MSHLADLLGISPAEAEAALAKLTPTQLVQAAKLAEIVDKADAQTRLQHMFPDATHDWRGETYHARDLYGRQLEFFAAGATYRERCFMAANRVGKTVSGAVEMAYHLTGGYPTWWQGRRFTAPVRAWAAGKTNETTRDILQRELLGDVEGSGSTKRLSGTGTIPGALLGTITWRQGVADLTDTVKVRHTSGRWSLLGLKSYQQGRGAFEGTAQHVIWFDEEPPEDVYGEALTRTMTTKGLIYITFTPLEGISAVVRSFLPAGYGTEAA